MIFVNGKRVYPTQYSDGTPSFEAPLFENYRNININWQYSSMEELFYVAILARHYQETYDSNVVLTMLYIPTARMDRVREDGEIFSLKYFAEIINALNFKMVRCLDPHSYVVEALIDRISVESPKEIINRVMALRIPEEDNINLIYYPTARALKYYPSMINRPYIYGVRDQDTDEVEIACKEGVVSGKNVLIVNDIIHSGEVFSDEARQLRMLGARKIYVFATHCENGAYVNPDLIDRIYTTDSIAHDATGDFIDHTHWEIINVEI